MITLGFDMGMGALKLWGKAGGLQLVSQVASNGREHLVGGILGLKNSTRPLEVHSSFGSFYVGQTAHAYGRAVENLNFDRLTGTPEMRALLYAALVRYQAQYGPFDDSLSLIVGLPLQMQFGDSAADYREGVRAWLKGTHEFTIDGITHRVEIAKVKQTSQPVGALYDYVLGEEGQMLSERGSVLLSEVAVVSVGFNTVELLGIKGQKPIYNFTGGNTAGVRRLLELINTDGLHSLGELDADLREGLLRDELNQAMPTWASEVNGVIEKRWGSRPDRRFSKIIVVGGGALLLRDLLTAQFGHKAWVAPDPVLSIAHGLWKLSEMRM